MWSSWNPKLLAVHTTCRSAGSLDLVALVDQAKSAPLQHMFISPKTINNVYQCTVEPVLSDRILKKQVSIISEAKMGGRSAGLTVKSNLQ